MSGDYRVSQRGEDTVEQLVGQGFVIPAKPDDHPSIPPDITDLSSEGLMELFAQFVAWSDFANTQLGLAVIEEREAERRVTIAEAEAWKSLPKSSVSAAKVLVAADEGVVSALEELDAIHAYRRMVSEIASRYERDTSLISRELTRRTSDGGSFSRPTRKARWLP